MGSRRTWSVNYATLPWQPDSWESAYITDFQLEVHILFLSSKIGLFDNKATTEVRVSRTTSCGNHGNIAMVTTGSEIMLCWLDYSKPLQWAKEAENSWAESLLLLLHPVQPWIEGFCFRLLPGQVISKSLLLIVSFPDPPSGGSGNETILLIACHDFHISLIPSKVFHTSNHFHISHIRREFSLRFVL